MGIAEVITVFAIVATNLVTVVALHIHSDNKTQTFLNAIQTKMKDFMENYVQLKKETKNPDRPFLH